ncbi:MAG: hypothetical protein FWC87_02970, partial [Acidimicrobiaceae bacterium]|nr:hypothetical protein [Acidimicrobiaceae bacterium]
MSLGSLRRSVRRPAWVAVLASLAVVFVAVLGPFWVKQARAGGLSGQDYTSFVITGGGGALAAYDAENPGAPEVTIPAPAGADFNAVAIDPTAAQVLVTVTPGTANPAEVMAFSTSGAALGALPVSLSDPGPIAISGSGSVGVGDLEGPSFVQLSVHQNGPPSLVGSAPTTLPDLTSGRTVLVASVCALAYSPSGKQLYVGADYQFVSEVPTTPCEPGPRSITELRDYGPGGLQGSVL